MATEDEKKLNMLHMTQLSLEVLAAEVWDTLGETSMVLANGMGDAILEMIEKEEGLEIAGENPLDVGKEINRIFVDEFGFAKEISLDVDKDNIATMKVTSCSNTKLTDKLLADGVTTAYICPIMLACSAALRNMGIKSHVKIERWQEGKGCKIFFIPA